MSHTLIVFAREPIAGRTKTRLCPPFDGATAALLYGCFLRDTLALARHTRPDHRTIAYTPESDSTFFERLAPDFDRRAQRGAGLGERMDNAFGDIFDRQSPAAQPPHSAVLIGSDIPHMPAGFLRRAFAHLDDGADVVLGPAEDGGYYLIGLRTRQARLLCDVPMSTPTVLSDTLALVRALGLRAKLLP
ncbi:MAG TPA: TIGR04282 family arsenosugar biosynthesis glycosyltransferase, partial [Roseiflexaceae bacterium]|nr:TIGR04282 family arsenosugar biosynthesis glycosyltransferase [Roseiflexaceae bacterium]